VLDTLANDEDLSVQEGVAGNPSTSADTLRRLAVSEDPDVRRAVAGNSNADDDTRSLAVLST